jgi:hypothetical protein
LVPHYAEVAQPALQLEATALQHAQGREVLLQNRGLNAHETKPGLGIGLIERAQEYRVTGNDGSGDGSQEG